MLTSSLSVGGQGIASGFRDAIALSWRLALACRTDSAIDHELLLVGWYTERKQQLEKSLASTVRNGAMVNSRNPIHIFLRDWTLWFLQLIPFSRHRLEMGPKSAGRVRYTHFEGLPFLPEFLGGINFPQTYCVSLSKGGPVQFTDDSIFEKSKRRLFHLVILLSSLDDWSNAMCEIADIHQITDELSVEEATFFVDRRSLPMLSTQRTNVDSRIFRTAAGEEFADSDLCLNRPVPRGYDETLMWREMKGSRFIILRPDRFVFAACRTKAELERAAGQLAQFVSGQSHSA